MVQAHPSPLLSTPAFAPEHLVGDLEQLALILTQSLDAIPTKSWTRPTEKHGAGWTMHETLAHVTTTAELYLQTIEKALTGERFARVNVTRRYELPALQKEDIATRHHLPPTRLLEQLAQALRQTALLIPMLSNVDLMRPTAIAFFDRPPTIIELIGTQLVHPAIIHAQQLTVAASRPPLWNTYAPDFLQRNLTRFFQMLTFLYWRERERDLHATINYDIQGPAGGQWTLTLTPQGAYADKGHVERPTLTIWHPGAEAMCSCFTKESSLRRALVLGRMRFRGDLRLAQRLYDLFEPA
ncbi:maleylpyruvate isomerase N-terminal domain-containing protein [Ktedonobacter racemifer]|uniref:Sterol-binding domain protein n=1 Tax=Ktedonobacter racemifer DSM 44963 TaxID=485913 RepID=D6TR80_KTERA|nr:maleylpyruvate isomerase N-terminal domain-containing protein [Ktedonobacter racemifer]EFH87779.1 Sterol-binding domain protein [Ktedonobacter racemifer DSM 44963]